MKHWFAFLALVAAQAVAVDYCPAGKVPGPTLNGGIELGYNPNIPCSPGPTSQIFQTIGEAVASAKSHECTTHVPVYPPWDRIWTVDHVDAPTGSGNDYGFLVVYKSYDTDSGSVGSTSVSIHYFCIADPCAARAGTGFGGTISNYNCASSATNYCVSSCQASFDYSSCVGDNGPANGYFTYTGSSCSGSDGAPPSGGGTSGGGTSGGGTSGGDTSGGGTSGGCGYVNGEYTCTGGTSGGSTAGGSSGGGTSGGSSGGGTSTGTTSGGATSGGTSGGGSSTGGGGAGGIGGGAGGTAGGGTSGTTTGGSSSGGGSGGIGGGLGGSSGGTSGGGSTGGGTSGGGSTGNTGGGSGGTSGNCGATKDQECYVKVDEAGTPEKDDQVPDAIAKVDGKDSDGGLNAMRTLAGKNPADPANGGIDGRDILSRTNIPTGEGRCLDMKFTVPGGQFFGQGGEVVLMTPEACAGFAKIRDWSGWLLAVLVVVGLAIAFIKET